MYAQSGTIAVEHSRARQFGADDWRLALLVISVVAVATRIVSWWNPAAHPDDPFYLFVGNRMLHGEWPYLDIWDRKPVGLFALYAMIASVAGASILAVNIVATTCVVATAMVIRRLALFIASPLPATFAALGYVLNLPLLGGQNGQSPVFYNLLIAIAAYQLFKFADEPTDRSGRRALIAMLMCGVALTIKTVTVFEGIYFGLAFLWIHRQRGMSASALAGLASTMVAVAILPFAASAIPFLMKGGDAFDAFAYANFESIFVKPPWGLRAKLIGAAILGLYATLLIGYGIAGAFLRRHNATAASRLLLGWLLAALVGFFSVPNMFDHYLLPVLVPLAVSASTLFIRPVGQKLFVAFVFFCVVQRQVWDWRLPATSTAEYTKMSAIVSGALDGGCLYVAQGPPLLYETTGACRLSRYAFPHHLIVTVEQGAIGTDNLVELRRVLAARPAVITTRKADRIDNDRRAQAILTSALQTDYRPIYVSSDKLPGPVRSVTIFQRRDLFRRG